MRGGYVCWRCSVSPATRQATSRPGQRIRLDAGGGRVISKAFASSPLLTATETQAPDSLSTDIPPPKFLGLKYRHSIPDVKANIRAQLQEWDAKAKVEQREELKARDEQITSSLRSPITQLALKTKAQRDILLESEDQGSERYSVLQGLDDADVRAQFFDESVASFEEEALQPGDLVDFFDKTSAAIYIGPGQADNRRAAAQLFTARGDLIEVPESKISFRIPRFIDPHELKGILPYVPINGQVRLSAAGLADMAFNVPRDLGAPIIAKLIEFEGEAAKVYRAHTRALDGCWEHLGDSQDSHTISLPDATNKLLKLPENHTQTPAELWAVHKALTSVEHGAVKDLDYRTNQDWHLMSKRQVNLVNLVTEWWHEYQLWKMQNASTSSARKAQETSSFNSGPSRGLAARTDSRVFARFIAMARTMIAQERSKKTLLDMRGVQIDGSKEETKSLYTTDSHHGFENGKFEESHSAILQFLLLVVQRQVRHTSEATAIAAMIVREVGFYSHVEDHNYSPILFLQEMGVLSPWEIAQVHLSYRRIPFYNLESKLGKAWLLAEQSTEADNKLSNDKLDTLRTDWGQREVYCVDDASTTVIDDGFSIEKIPGDESHLWFHVHIANPTAFFDEKHPIAQYSRIVGSTAYLPNEHFDMMPSRFVSECGSLDEDRRCLTFSAKLDRSGSIVDSKITPSIIHNVLFLTPSTLRKVTSGQQLREFSANTRSTDEQLGSHILSERRTRLLPPSDLSTSQIEDLRLWREFAEARYEKRTPLISRLMETAYTSETTLKVRNAPATAPDWTTVRHFHEEPEIAVSFSATTKEPAEQFKRVDLVAEAMLLAGTVAASWCAKRGIPAPYRISTTPEGMPSQEKYFEEYVKPALKTNQSLPRSMLTDMASLQKSTNSIAPKEHQALGLDAYLRVTSPLRRFVDMLAHFQIEAALLQELNGNALDPTSLPYTAGEMSKEVKAQIAIQRQSFLLSANARRQWMIRYIAKALAGTDGAVLPPVVTARLTAKSSPYDQNSEISFVIEGLRIPCEAENVSDIPSSDMLVGARFEAEIVGVSSELQKARVKLLKAHSQHAQFSAAQLPDKYFDSAGED